MAQEAITDKHPNDNICECVAVHVDNLAFTVKDPRVFAEALEKKCHFNLRELVCFHSILVQTLPETTMVSCV